jgi:hypothetical protein
MLNRLSEPDEVAAVRYRPTSSSTTGSALSMNGGCPAR